MFYSVFKKIFNKQIQLEKNKAYYEGKRQALQERADTHLACDMFTLEQAVGKKAIYVPNEWTDPSFLIVTGITSIGRLNKQVHETYDVLKQAPSIALVGTIYLADEQMVLAMLKLNPFERWNLSAGKVHFNNMWTKSYALNDNDVTDSDVLESRLRQVNFI